MKDTHNIILTLVSSKWLIPYSGGSSKFLISFVHLSFPEFKVFLGYIISKLHPNHCKASPCVFNLSFFLSPFYYRSSSWRLYMVVRQGFFSFFNCSSRFLSKLWPAKLYSKVKHGVQHMFFSEEFKYSSSCISKCNSFYLSFWGGVMSFLTISIHVSWFTCCQEWGILNPSISSLELSCVIFHLKPSLRNVAIVVLINDPSYLFIILVEEVFIS